jgi:hypothetical protein
VQNVVVFVEDPGAVNCVAPFVSNAIATNSLKITLLSAGQATKLLEARGLCPIEVERVGASVELLKQTRAHWLFVGTSENPESPAFPLIVAARAAGVSSAAIIDSSANAAFRFRGCGADPLRYAPDWILVPDQWTASEFVALGLSPKRIVLVGHPHYDYLAAAAKGLRELGKDHIRRMVLPELSQGRKVLVFASEISTGLDPQQFRKSADYTLQGRGEATSRTEIVVEEILDAISALEAEGYDRPFLVLRRHPKETAEDLASYRESFDCVSDAGAALELLVSADLVVGMSSMLLTEAHFLGTPTISVLPRPMERNWLPIVREGIIPCATNRGDLLRMLREFLVRARAAEEAGGLKSASSTKSGSVEKILAFLNMTAAERAQ